MEPEAGTERRGREEREEEKGRRHGIRDPVHEGWPVPVRAAQVERSKSHLRIIDKDVNNIAERVDIYSSLELLSLIINIKHLCLLCGN